MRYGHNRERYEGWREIFPASKLHHIHRNWPPGSEGALPVAQCEGLETAEGGMGWSHLCSGHSCIMLH